MEFNRGNGLYNMRQRLHTPIATAAIMAIGLLLTGCGDPMGPLPGGKLDGEPTSIPSDWAFTAATEDFQLETNPDDPYSVNIWAVDIGAAIYVASGGGETTWSENMQDNGNVVLRHEDNIYSLHATQVTDVEELQRVLERYEEKYDLGEIGDEADPAEAVVYRLGPRTMATG